MTINLEQYREYIYFDEDEDVYRVYEDTPAEIIAKLKKLNEIYIMNYQIPLIIF